MKHWLSMFGLMTCLVLGFASQADAKLAPTQSQASTFQYSGKLPKLISSRLSLEALLPKGMKKKLALQTQEQGACTDGACPVVIVQDGVNPGLRIAGLVLNILLPFAVGSWVAGDRLGYIIGSSLWGGGLAVFLLGYVFAILASPAAAYTMLTAGALLMFAGWVIPIITVSTFRRSVWFWRRRRRIYYRRRYYRRRYYRRYQAPSGVTHTGPLAQIFKQTASNSSTVFTF